MESLKRARELFEQIDFSRFADVTGSGTYTLDDGRLTCSVVLRNEFVEVLNCIAKPGCRVPAHTHIQTEHYLLYDGEATITTDAGVITLSRLDSPHIDPGVSHSLYSKTGCHLLIIRVPPVTNPEY